MKSYCYCVVIILVLGPVFGVSPAKALSVDITVVPGVAAEAPAIGNWHKLSDGNGWKFRPASVVYYLELALYDPAEELSAGQSPFAQSVSRTSGDWPDGPENEAGELGYEVSPNVLGDSNAHLYGKAHYRSLKLYDGELSPDSVYQVSFSGTPPPHIWVHPLYSSCFTMSTGVLQSTESTLQNAAWGPATVNRVIVDPFTTRFEYTGLLPGAGTGLKDNYAVQTYGQRSGSHGNGDFGWFPGYSQMFVNEGPAAVYVALFVNTGFTGPSGAPSNNPANDTYWKSSEIFLTPGDSAVAALDFDDVTGWGVADNPFPHTAGGKSVPNGTSNIAVNVFDRLQVSAIGWEVRSGTGGEANASLVALPFEFAPWGPTVGSFVSPGLGDAWDIGSAEWIVWIPGTSAVTRTIQISRDGGPWEDVAAGVPNTGELLWTATGPAADVAVFRIFPSGNPAAAQPSEAFTIVDPTTAVPNDRDPFVGKARVERIAPNPFSAAAEIRYVLAQRGPVVIDVYDVRGGMVRRLVAGVEHEGPGVALWDGTDERGERVSSGVYFVRLQTRHGTASRAVTLVR